MSTTEPVDPGNAGWAVQGVDEGQHAVPAGAEGDVAGGPDDMAGQPVPGAVGAASPSSEPGEPTVPGPDEATPTAPPTPEVGEVTMGFIRLERPAGATTSSAPEVAATAVATTSEPPGGQGQWYSASTPGVRPSASAGLVPAGTTSLVPAAALEGATHAVRSPSARLRRLVHQHPYELEAALVLALCLGQSAVYSVLRIIERMTRHVPLSQQTSQLNTAATPDRPWLSLVYELADLFFLPVPAALALYLVYRVARPRVGALAGMGLRTDRWRADLLWGLAFFAGIGFPGLGLYLGARALGLNTTVEAANLGQYWWSIPVLVLSALANALLEEVVMIGYLFTRLRQAHWPLWRILVLSAAIRGGYHLYQGFGGFVGNLLMGLLFGVWFLRTRRTWPLVVCHFLLDVASFVGYALLAGHVSWL